MIDEKDMKKLLNLCTKLSYIFNDFYILKNGYILSTNSDKPFVVQVEQQYTEWFEKLCGDFKILHIWDVKKFKKDNTNYFSHVSSRTEENKIVNVLTTRITEINMHTNWENFLLSENSDDNQNLLLSLFKKNDYVNFKPNDTEDSPDIILTKSLLPLVSEKNYTDLYYSSRKINSELYIIVFDFQFNLFRLHMLHNYVPIK